MKVCGRCGKEKPLSEYYQRDQYADGHYTVCKECLREARRERYKEHREVELEVVHRRLENPIARARNAERSAERRRTDPKARLSHNISAVMRKSLCGKKAGRRWTELVGYSLADLAEHLEQRFQPGMAWENYGQWEVDHVLPISSFGYTAPEEDSFKRCWALENLWPAWAIENRLKGARWEEPDFYTEAYTKQKAYRENTCIDVRF